MASSISETTIRAMDPINFIKGYNKLNHLEDQAAPSTHTHRKPLLITITISFILLFTLIIGVVVGALVHHSYTQSPESPSLSSSYADSIKTICNVTQYPVSCFSTLSTLDASPKFDPELIFMASLKISFAHLSNLSSFPKTLILRAKDPRSEAALRDCESLLEAATAQVNNTMLAMEVGPGKKMMTESKIEDMRTWLSSAITDQETCLDGLEEMNSSVVEEVKNAMQPSKEFTSNSLAILANIKVLLQNFNLTMH